MSIKNEQAVLDNDLNEVENLIDDVDSLELLEDNEDEQKRIDELKDLIKTARSKNGKKSNQARSQIISLLKDDPKAFSELVSDARDLLVSEPGKQILTPTDVNFLESVMAEVDEVDSLELPEDEKDKQEEFDLTGYEVNDAEIAEARKEAQESYPPEPAPDELENNTPEDPLSTPVVDNIEPNSKFWQEVNDDWQDIKANPLFKYTFGVLGKGAVWVNKFGQRVAEKVGIGVAYLLKNGWGFTKSKLEDTKIGKSAKFVKKYAIDPTVSGAKIINKKLEVKRAKREEKEAQDAEARIPEAFRGNTEDSTEPSAKSEPYGYEQLVDPSIVDKIVSVISAKNILELSKELIKDNKELIKVGRGKKTIEYFDIVNQLERIADNAEKEPKIRTIGDYNKIIDRLSVEEQRVVDNYVSSKVQESGRPPSVKDCAEALKKAEPEMIKIRKKMIDNILKEVEKRLYKK